METGNKSLVARRHNLSPNLVYKWVKTFQDHDRQEAGHHEVVSPAEIKQLEAENDLLKKLLGEKDLEIVISMCTIVLSLIITLVYTVAGHLVQRALFKRKQFEKEHKPVIRTDNGPQFVSNAFEKVCNTVKLSMSGFHRRYQI
ncbi:transposase [Bacillus cereus]|uniref:transposase n=1 Tax=Bacillus cereus TaxID=1396 RepID=UPI0018F466FF|nr:transposase [Bacillus cereus]MBJ8055328.1 transposase [Bacillus cereus]